MNKLIVYGTLLKGEHNAFMMEGAEFLGPVIIPNAVIYDLGGCPGLHFLPMSEYAEVKGELYNVNDEMRDRLDRFEGHPNMYERIEAEYHTEHADGRDYAKAWIYEYQGECYEPPIPSGDWRLRHNLP